MVDFYVKFLGSPKQRSSMFIHQKNAKESDIIFCPKEGDMVNLNSLFNRPVAFLKQAKRALAEMKKPLYGNFMLFESYFRSKCGVTKIL